MTFCWKLPLSAAESHILMVLLVRSELDFILNWSKVQKVKPKSAFPLSSSACGNYTARSIGYVRTRVLFDWDSRSQKASPPQSILQTQSTTNHDVFHS